MSLFQHSDAVDAWGLHGAREDDMAIIAPDDTIAAFFDGGSGPATNLSTDGGWANVERALRAAAGGP